MAAEVGSGVVFKEQRPELLKQALCGSVFGHGPHRVVACHQEEVCLGQSQSLLQPGQLPVCVHHTQRASGFLIGKVQGVAAKHHGVEHDYGQSLPSVGNMEVQLIVIRWKFPGTTK